MFTNLKRSAFLFLIIFTAAALMGFRSPQSDQIEFKNVQFFYEYGESATIQAEFESALAIESINLYIHPDKQLTNTIEITDFKQGEILQEISSSQLNFYPFTRVYYWFEVNFENGASYTSSSFWFDYIDNRSAWKTREFENLTIYWQNEPESFATDVYNTAKLGLEEINKRLDTSLPDNFKIVIYPDALSLQSALNIRDALWVAGHASPDIGLVILSIPSGPNQSLELERQLPHELMHLMHYQIAGPSYEDQPTWLKEGLASNVELYPNPDYKRILEKAVEAKSIVAMTEYCNQFPIDASGAFQAYAQSASFVNYLNDQYGSDKFQQLTLNYRNGLSCEEGFYQTYNETIFVVEKDWKKTILNMDVSPLGEVDLSAEQVSESMNSFSPYLLLSVFLILPPIISGFVLRKRDE